MSTDTELNDIGLFDIEKATEQDKAIAATEMSLITDIVKSILINNRNKYGAIWIHGISKEVVKLNWSGAFKIAYSEVIQCLTWHHDEVIANNGNRTVDKDKLRIALTNYIKLLFTMIIEMSYVEYFNNSSEENRQAITTALLENKSEVDTIYKDIEDIVINENLVQLTTVAGKSSLGELMDEIIAGGDDALCDILINLDDSTAANLYGSVLVVMVALENTANYTYIDILTDVKQTL